MEYYSSLKREGNSDIFYNMEKPWGQNAKSNKTLTKRQIQCDYLQEKSSVVNFIEIESRKGVARGWGEAGG